VNRKRLYLVCAAIAAFVAIAGCGGEDMKTPEDVREHVAFLDARSAFPHFPFGDKPIYMFFNALWCPISKGMRDDVFSRPEIITYMNENFTCISVIPDSIKEVAFLGQAMTGQDLIANFKIEGYPAHYFCSAEGKLLGGTSGEITLADFKRLLIYFGKGFYKKFDFDTFLETRDAKVDTVYGKF